MEINSSNGPGFMTQAHLITMSPCPPESGKEVGMARTSSINLNLAYGRSIKEEILSHKVEIKPNVFRESAVTQAVQYRFFVFSTSGAGSRSCNVSVMRERKSMDAL